MVAQSVHALATTAQALVPMLGTKGAQAGAVIQGVDLATQLVDQGGTDLAGAHGASNSTPNAGQPASNPDPQGASVLVAA